MAGAHKRVFSPPGFGSRILIRNFTKARAATPLGRVLDLRKRKRAPSKKEITSSRHPCLIAA